MAGVEESEASSRQRLQRCVELAGLGSGIARPMENEDGAADLAEPPLKEAARLMSDDPTIHEHLGRLYLRMGKETLAQQEWERALKEWPQAVSSDFDADQAAKLQRELEELKLRLAKQHSVQK